MRKKMFIKNLIVLLLITLLYGCNDDSNVKLEPITNVININTSTWSRGLYIVSLEVNGDYKKWRIFKE